MQNDPGPGCTPGIPEKDKRFAFSCEPSIIYDFSLSLQQNDTMTREELQQHIIDILVQDFEFNNPAPNDHLRDVHGFDSIDAIELLAKIEMLLGFSLTREEKEQAMGIRTISDILDYIEIMASKRGLAKS